MADPVSNDTVTSGHKFAAPPKEVTNYFNAKGLTPSWHWQDVAFDEHATAFTVAKSAGYDILTDLRDSLASAIQNRVDFKDWSKAIEPTLKAKGWWGKVTGTDPVTGKTHEVQLGSPRRLATIYNANVRTAYAAGQWSRIQASKRVLPYLQYQISTALHKRPEHLGWVGTLLPVDDDWWSTHYPPNGWNCQCRVRQVSHYEAHRPREDGSTLYNKDVRPENYGTRDYVNKRTGDVSKVPVGIDPGWANNPGAVRMQQMGDFIAGRLDKAPEAARVQAVSDIVHSEVFGLMARGLAGFDPQSHDPAMIDKGRFALPMAMLDADQVKTLGAKSGLVRLSVAAAAAQGLDPADYAKLQDLIEHGQSEVGDQQMTLRGQIDGVDWMATLAPGLDASGNVYLQSLSKVQK
ncbi:MAG: hypothetical protein KGQ46_12420 [Hyphomicrobiales bacterium]|nr:hypothetical protein [Hyphomicrobiales bacterium]MDE2113835.1 hypothetical protein [Hyphomicrobiales bacterium]